MKIKSFLGKTVGLSVGLLVVAHSALAGFVEPVGQPITFDVIEQTIEIIANTLIYVSMIIAVIFIVWAGITYMSAGANSTAVAAAQGRLKSGMIGAAIVLAVGVILSTIDYFVNLDFLSPF